MPGVYGFLLQLSVVVFGTVVGDWVDLNPRLRGMCCSGWGEGGRGKGGRGGRQEGGREGRSEGGRKGGRREGVLT